MPYLQKNKRKTTYQKHDKSKDIAKIYNTSQWQKLRAAYFMEHPICERCLEKYGKTTPTAEIHHKIPISKGRDFYEMQTLAYDYNNLMALCEQCHHEIHNNMRKNKS